MVNDLVKVVNTKVVHLDEVLDDMEMVNKHLLTLLEPKKLNSNQI